MGRPTSGVLLWTAGSLVLRCNLKELTPFLVLSAEKKRQTGESVFELPGHFSSKHELNVKSSGTDSVGLPACFVLVLRQLVQCHKVLHVLQEVPSNKHKHQEWLQNILTLLPTLQLIAVTLQATRQNF